MSHPLVEFLLARYDEEDPTHTNPVTQELRDSATMMEFYLIASDDTDADADGIPKRDVAWAGLRLQGLRFRNHPDYNNQWLPAFAKGAPNPEEPAP